MPKNKNSKFSWILELLGVLGVAVFTTTTIEEGLGQDAFSFANASSQETANNPEENIRAATSSIPATIGVGIVCAPFSSSENSSAEDLIIIRTENKCKINQIERYATRDFNKHNKTPVLERGVVVVAKDSESANVIEDIFDNTSMDKVLFHLNVLEKLLTENQEKSA